MTPDEYNLETLIKEIQRYFSSKQLDEIAKRAGFIKRRRKLTSKHFLHLCLGESQAYLQNSLSRICGNLRKNHTVNISTEGLNQRFSPEAVCFLKEVFYQFFCLRNPKLTFQSNVFNRLRIADSSGFSLPVTYKDGYEGSTSSGVKIQLEYELLSGQFLELEVQDGKESDISFARKLNQTLLPGDLCIRDLGYFSGEFLKEIDERGAYFISRLRNQSKVYKNLEGGWKEIDLVEWGSSLKKGETIEINDVYLGGKKLYIPRLMIHHLTDEQLENRLEKQKKVKKKKGGALTSNTLKKNSYNFIVTNVPQDDLSIQETYKMYSLRWQIEILFKTWKSIYKINHVKKVKKERFECHLYSTLISILVSSTITFQVRTYLFRKKNLEISEFKSMNLLRDYFPDLIKANRKPKEHARIILEILKKQGIKSIRGKKQSAGMILMEIGVV